MSELEIKIEFIESLNIISDVKSFNVEKIYKDISLCYCAIKERQRIIIQIFKDLKTEKIIEDQIQIHFKNAAKELVSIKIQDLTPKILTKTRKICFTEKLN